MQVPTDCLLLGEVIFRFSPLTLCQVIIYGNEYVCTDSHAHRHKHKLTLIHYSSAMLSWATTKWLLHVHVCTWL